MIKSMTGFGRGEASGPSVRYEVDLRGVNGRFLEVRFRLPQEVSQMEAELRALVSKVIRRGRIDITINRTQAKDPETVVLVNRDVVARYLEAASLLARDFQIPGALSLESALALPGAVRIEVKRDGNEGEQEVLLGALRAALAAFDGARAAEGARLREDLKERVLTVERELAEIEDSAGNMPLEHTSRLRKRMAELLEGVPLDEARLAQEAAYLAGRSDVTEEIVRLRAHLRQALEHLDSGDQPAGKPLDFLVQEMHREVNTIGSKSEDLRISQAVLRMKAEVEKVREQVQNIE